MDFVVKKGDLLRELQFVQGVVEKKSTVPILSNILLETTGNKLSVTATDLDVTIRCACQAKVKVSGALTVSARKLFDIVRLLPEADVHFKLANEDWVNISCQRSKFKIASLSKDNFPDVPSVDGSTINLPADALRHMIARSIFAITQEESRFSLNGALLILQPRGLTMVTTDGHRLALITRSGEIAGVDAEMRHLVPRKTLIELSKLSADEESPIEFGSTENHLFFRVGERLLISRVLTGQFPNYEMVVPQENDKSVVLTTLDFADALRRVAVMADEQTRAVRFALEEGNLEVASNNADYGEAREAIPVKYEGEELTICFNATYLLDFLGGLESEQVNLLLRDAETQGLLKPGEPGDYDYSYVVMPMKL